MLVLILSVSHCAIPECSLEDINLGIEFRIIISQPFYRRDDWWQRATSINRALAEVAETAGIGFAVGSQRASLEAGSSQADLRALAPSIPLIGNLGGIQLAQADGLDLARRAVDDLQADAIHLNLFNRKLFSPRASVTGVMCLRPLNGLLSLCPAG